MVSNKFYNFVSCFLFGSIICIWVFPSPCLATNNTNATYAVLTGGDGIIVAHYLNVNTGLYTKKTLVSGLDSGHIGIGFDSKNLYFSHGGKIEKAGIDGTGRTVKYTSGHTISSLFVDSINQKIYWGEDFYDTSDKLLFYSVSISSSNFGSSKSLLFDGTSELPKCCGCSSIVVLGNFAYMSQRSRKEENSKGDNLYRTLLVQKSLTSGTTSKFYLYTNSSGHFEGISVYENSGGNKIYPFGYTYYDTSAFQEKYFYGTLDLNYNPTYTIGPINTKSGCEYTRTKVVGNVIGYHYRTGSEYHLKFLPTGNNTVLFKDIVSSSKITSFELISTSSAVFASPIGLLKLSISMLLMYFVLEKLF